MGSGFVSVYTGRWRNAALPISFFRGYRVAVFVDGCFWHGCPAHGPSEFRGPNSARWHEKISVNKARDQRNNVAAETAGWIVVRVWECEIRADVEQAASRVGQACNTEATLGAQLQTPEDLR